VEVRSAPDWVEADHFGAKLRHHQSAVGRGNEGRTLDDAQGVEHRIHADLPGLPSLPTGSLTVTMTASNEVVSQAAQDRASFLFTM
jgi:hypothetical protein